MKIIIGCDHGGLALAADLAAFLAARGEEVFKIFPNSGEKVDYPDYASLVCERVLAENGALGILVCGSGTGMAIAANKIPNIRAANCANEYQAKMARAHNDCNVLCLGERVLGADLARGVVCAFLGGVFEGGRHENRVAKIAALEAKAPKIPQ